jgi:hypothetical protein
MNRLLAFFVAALLAGAAHAQQWVQLEDALAFDKAPPIWCNAQRSACIISRQVYGTVGAVRVALTVAGTPDCRQRRPRYIYVKSNGEMNGDLSKVHEVLGQTCIFDIPAPQVEGMRLLRFSVPMLTQDAVIMELSLDGFDASRLGANRS